jgi:hypothetical protein
MTDINLYLNNTYFYKVLETRPPKSKTAPGQRFIHQQLFPWHDFGERDILMQRAKANNQLATPYGPEGQPQPPPREGGEQQLVTLIDFKAFDNVNPSVVQQDRVLGEMAVSGTLKSAGVFQRKVRDAVSRMIVNNANRIDNVLELVAIGALKNSFVWPPTDDDGNAISNPPNYWETNIGETNWTFGLPSNLNQDLASLTTWKGDAATADQKKYWSETDADIIGSLNVMDQICRNLHGFSIRDGTILCRSSLLHDYLIKNATILSMLRGSNYEQPGARTYIPIPVLEGYFRDQLGYTFSSYDTFWTYETSLAKGADHTSTVVHYLKENEIIILPPGNLGGNAMMGTCPIEHQDETWRPGIMPWMLRDPRPPFNREAGVHTVAWPVFEYLTWARLQVLA